MATSNKTNRVADQRAGSPQAGDLLSPDLDREVYGLVSRVIKAANVDAVAGECGVDRSTIWKWAKSPRKVYIGEICRLSDNDPDPDGLMRVAGCLLAYIANRALARERQGRTRIVIEEIGPGRYGRRS